MEKLLEMTLRWDGFTKPLIADKATGTILDGHHDTQLQTTRTC